VKTSWLGDKLGGNRQFFGLSKDSPFTILTKKRKKNIVGTETKGVFMLVHEFRTTDTDKGELKALLEKAAFPKVIRGGIILVLGEGEGFKFVSCTLAQYSISFEHNERSLSKKNPWVRKLLH